MHRRHVIRSLATVPILPALWGQAQTRVWLGPQHWANPLQDWRRRGARIECFVSGGDRNIYWLDRETVPDDFRMSVKLGKLDPTVSWKEGWVGFRIGVRGHFDDYRDSAIRGLGVACGIKHDGTLFFGPGSDGTKISIDGEIDLSFTVNEGKFSLSANGVTLEGPAPADATRGGVSLVCHSGDYDFNFPTRAEPRAANDGKAAQARGGNVTAWFSDWKLEGVAVKNFPERAWGPILFAQHTLHRRVLKLTAQLAPQEGDEGRAQLVVDGRMVAEVAPETFSSCVTFRLSDFDDSRDHPYEIRFANASYKGTIPKDPRDKAKLTVGSLTCQGDFGFPHTSISANVAYLKPDLLLFTGDQLYEANGGYGVQRAPLSAARLDYLRKWYMYGWAWGELTRSVPTVCLPDDHDVYHGNLWGASGRRTEAGNAGADYPVEQAQQDSGGYKMPANWVNMVQRTQTSHLPDPADPELVDQDITVFFSHLICGGVSFALLEDRKFKSAPRALLPQAKIRNGWPQNAAWDAAKVGDVKDATLLGPRQEKFLADWARDWDGIEMKAAVSATIFCNLCTLPQSAMDDSVTPKLPLSPRNVYVAAEKLTMDHDSNGWPQTARTRAVRLLRSAMAVHLAGDQHLGSTLQYGVDDHNDGSFALCSPAISNIWPRRWFPPLEGANRERVASIPMHRAQTGEFLDGFGNRMTVHAVANPHFYDQAPHALNDRAPGFGFVTFDKTRREITLTNWPRWVDLTKPSSRPYQGWPVRILDEDNGLNGARFELKLPSSVEGVVEVRLEATGELVYAWRLPNARRSLKVWKPGSYSVRAGSTLLRRLPSSPL